MVYADLAFTEYLRAVGLPIAGGHADGTETFTVRAEVDFRSPARFDDMLELCVRTERIGTASFTAAFLVRRGDETLAEIRNTYANADPKLRRSAPLPEALVDAITAFERVPPVRASGRPRG